MLTSPVSGELFLNGGDDELLHFLVRLSDQVNRRALLHDTDVILQSLANHLGAKHIDGHLRSSHIFSFLLSYLFIYFMFCVLFFKDESENIKKKVLIVQTG